VIVRNRGVLLTNRCEPAVNDYVDTSHGNARRVYDRCSNHSGTKLPEHGSRQWQEKQTHHDEVDDGERNS
jgi:hypothetical protein